MTNGKSKLQKFREQRSESQHEQSIAKLLEKMHPDDPLRPFVEAMGEIQRDVAAVKVQVATPASAVDKLDWTAVDKSDWQQKDLDREKKRKFDGQLDKLMDVADMAIRAAARNALEDNFKRFKGWTGGVFGIGMVTGAILALWFGHPEARRIYAWNQTQLRQCTKVQKTTCNFHIVPPDQR